MVQYMTARLDTSFAALSDPTRRGVLGQLGRAGWVRADWRKRRRDSRDTVSSGMHASTSWTSFSSLWARDRDSDDDSDDDSDEAH